MKILRVLMVAAVCGGFASAAFAETYPWPHEAGPTIYKKLFENDEVRVSEIKFNPGEKIAMHHHDCGHSIYILEAGQLTISHPDGTSAVVDGKAGDVMWMGAEDHAAQNTGATTLRALITEVKKSK